MKASEIFEKTTEQLIAALENAQAGDWTSPFVQVPAGRPHNVVSGKAYRGGNAFGFMLSGYVSPCWASFKQWVELGWCVRKGEKATHGVYWTEAKNKKVGGKLVPLAEGEKGAMIPFGFAVFNFEQVAELEGFEGRRWMPPVVAERPEHETIAHADEFFAAVGAEVGTVRGIACYSRVTDRISVPPMSDFDGADSYYSVLAHEHGHWTGHESRLNRDLSGRFGSQSYAAEELVAEITAAFTMAYLGLSAVPRKDHAEYLASWLQVLRSDSKALYAAASLAQAAADRMGVNGDAAPEAGSEAVSGDVAGVAA